MMTRSPQSHPPSDDDSRSNALAKTNGKSQELVPQSSPDLVPTFDQPVILQQSPTWSRAIVWAIMGITTFAVVWACVAKIEEAVPAQGKLEPKGAVKEIQTPVTGVVQEMFVEEGERVEAGDTLVAFDPTTAQAQQQALLQVQAKLNQENDIYRATLAGSSSTNSADIPAGLALLTENRASLIAENRLYRTLLQGGPGSTLSAAQQERLRASQAELNSRVTAAELEEEQLQRQLNQVRVQLANARSDLSVNQRILDDIEPLVREGGLARLQFLRQQQEVTSAQAEIDRFVQEEERLKVAIEQAKEQLLNVKAQSRDELFLRIAENEKDIAAIESQFSKVLIENDKRLEEIAGQLQQAQLTLRYQELTAPISGSIFDVQVSGPGYVANSSTTLLSIVPNDSLIARVFITNSDIGFVEEGMEVDVRIDSFPYSEFGDVKGKLVSIGSDALPPDEIYPFYRFPAEIEIEQQSIRVKERDILLQSGMSLSANIKVRKRTVASIFTDLFSSKLESLRFTR
ncbi:MAG: HlyD family type I secretion periplasmic adaptor subunit [Cyanobacteria bacterium J06642_2]